MLHDIHDIANPQITFCFLPTFYFLTRTKMIINFDFSFEMSINTDISRNPSVLTTKSFDYVGFANLKNQVFRRCVKNGFDFTLMVVGK